MFSMTVASDLCRSGGASLKKNQRIFSKNYRKITPLAFGYTRPYMPPRNYFHSDIPPRPPNANKSALKKTQGGRRGRYRPRRVIVIAPSFFGTLEKTKSPVPWAFLVRDFEGTGSVGV